MPACDARYDVTFNPGTGAAAFYSPHSWALLDMDEDRLPDDWGDPGPLQAARLTRWWAGYGVECIEYFSSAPHGRRLWVNGRIRPHRVNRRYLRWRLPDAIPLDDPTDYEFPP